VSFYAVFQRGLPENERFDHDEFRSYPTPVPYITHHSLPGLRQETELATEGAPFAAAARTALPAGLFRPSRRQSRCNLTTYALRSLIDEDLVNAGPENVVERTYWILREDRTCPCHDVTRGIRLER